MAKDKPTPAADLATELSTPVARVPHIPAEDFLSTGCTLMDLAFSRRVRCGVPKGNYLYLVGDSGSTKTWFAFNLYAEAARNPHFKKYRFVFDNAENGALMDIEKFFGAGVVDRMEPPNWTKPVKGTKDTPARAAAPRYSETAQEFYLHLEHVCRAGPCIYVLDSMDALNDDEDEDKFQAELTRHLTGKGQVPGSMGMAKAKTNSKNINRVVQALRPHGSILVVISQTRDKVGGMFPGQKTRGGGKALKFFAHQEAWTSVRGPLTRRWNGKEREYGSTIKVDIQKNRVCGWEGKFELEFIKGFGVDDVGTNVEYLLEEKHWKFERKAARSDEDDDTEGKVFAAPEFHFTGTKEQLVARVQDGGDEWELQQLVAKVWNAVIDNAAPARKLRYT